MEPKKQKIKLNRAKCRQCGEVVTSIHIHDFRKCKCGQIHVDGGLTYIKRGGNLSDIIELSEYEEDN